MDVASAQLIAELQLADLREFINGSAGDNNADARVAEQAYLEELQGLTRFCEDARLARSVGVAVRADHAMLEEHVQQESQASHDRELAQALEAGAEPHGSLEGEEETIVETADDFDILTLVDHELQPEPIIHHPCTICSEQCNHTELHTNPCGHEYCHDCIKKLFVDSMTDESLYPPRCCSQVITAIDVAHILGPAVL